MTEPVKMESPSAIVLATINARYIHAALGLRYLLANMGDLQGQALVREFSLDAKPEDIVEKILRDHPPYSRTRRLHLECSSDHRSGETD